MNYPALLKEIKHEVCKMYGHVNNPGLLYHNLEHTEQVVAACSKMADFYKLDEKEQFTLVAAAWFHDTGFCLGKVEGHEEAGADLAENFLKYKLEDQEILQGIRNCILATKMPQKPGSLLEQVNCDADLFHMGTDLFWERNKLLRKELEYEQDKKISKHEWRKNSIAFMEAHEFQSSYGKTFLQQGKLKNIERLKEKNNDLPVPAEEMVNDETTAAMSTDKKTKKKEGKPDRSVETMFRIISSNNQRLSDMADNKAHIMITTTSIIISILLSVLVRKLEENPNLIIPVILLLSVCVCTMVLAIIVTRPGLPEGTFKTEDVTNHKVNLIFFGNFFKMPFEEYNAGMQQVMADRDFLYGSLTRDSHAQGVVLGRKYRLLRNCYNIFMFGIVISVLAFIIASFFAV